MPKRFSWRLITAAVFAAGLAVPTAADAQSAEELKRWIRWCEEEQNGTWNNDPSNPVCYPNTRDGSTSQGSGTMRPAMLVGTLLGATVGLGIAVKDTEDLPQDDPDKANKRLEGFALGMAAGYVATGLTLQLIAKHTTLPIPLRALLDGSGAARLSIHATGFRLDFQW